MTNTPRTDAETFPATPESEDLHPTMDVVSAEFASQLERELEDERALTDKLAAELADIEAASNDDEVDSCDFRKSCRYDIPKALAEWQQARNPAQTTTEGAE